MNVNEIQTLECAIRQISSTCERDAILRGSFFPVTVDTTMWGTSFSFWHNISNLDGQRPTRVKEISEEKKHKTGANSAAQSGAQSKHRDDRRAGKETISNQGSRTLIMQQTFRGWFLDRENEIWDRELKDSEPRF